MGGNSCGKGLHCCWKLGGASILAAAAVDAAAANMGAVRAADIAHGAGPVNPVIIGPDSSTSKS